MCQWNYFFQFRSNFVFSDSIRIRVIDDFELEEFTKNECCNLFLLFPYYHYSDTISLKEVNVNG